MSFKKFLILICTFFCTSVVFAQTPPIPPRKPIGGVTDGDNPYNNTRLRGERAPISPATLLLLGLSSATVGTRILRNTKRR